MNEEYMEALKELRLARSAFDWADEEFVDVACYRLAAAEARVQAIVLEKRLEI